MMATTTSNPKRLLILKFGAIGDVVMAIPAAAARHRDGYAVDWVCGSAAASVLALYPWIHLTVVDEGALLRGSKLKVLRNIWALWKTLRARVRENGAYDTVATLYYDRRYRLLSLPLQARRKVLLSRTDRAFRLLDGRHHTDEYDRILSGREDGEMPSQLKPIPPESLPPDPLPRTAGVPRVVVVSGGARNMLRDDALRRWPLELYVRLAEMLLERGFEVVLAGGPDDRWTVQAFNALADRHPERLVDRTGALSLVETVSLFDGADVTVTHDTGPLHLAGLARCAIVTIFGPVDPNGRLPQRPNCVALWGGEGFACRPCYDGHDYAPCRHNGCMEQVTPALVLHHIECLLAAQARGELMPPRVLTPEHTPPALNGVPILQSDTPVGARP